jgi:putative transposase
MPRVARVKNNESVTYIIVKGSTDVPLFRDDEDKKEYLFLLGRFKDIYGFKLYAYCIMQDYAHFIVDLSGADISSAMSSINLGYASKYNRKHNRKGHVFYDRFRSKIVRDELELKALTLYIHNSPISLEEYRDKPEKYLFSSLGAYLGLKDSFEMVDTDFIKGFIGEKPRDRKDYLSLVPSYDYKKLMEEVEISSKTSNSTYYTRKVTLKIDPEEILDFVSRHTGLSRIRLQSKYVRDSKDARAVLAFIMKNYFNMKNSEIAATLEMNSYGNLSKLFYRGLSLVETEEEYRLMVDKLKKEYIG